MTPDVLTIVAQFAFGFLVKKWPMLRAWPNRLIPIMNYALAILIGLAQGTAEAGFGDFFKGGLGKLLIDAAFNTLLTTGTHSFGKNLWQQVKKVA